MVMVMAMAAPHAWRGGQPFAGMGKLDDIHTLSTAVLTISFLSISMSMGLPSRTQSRRPSYLFTCAIPFSLFFLTILLLYKVDNFLSQTGTVAGHNLEPTPWHLFPPKTFTEQTRYARASKIIQCSYLTCPYAAPNSTPDRAQFPDPTETCPDFFSWIHRDLEPWALTGIS
ncbi:hypothetical protein CRG98_021150, partial [Punica granatum]